MRAILYLLLTLVFLYAGALVWFIQTMPQKPLPAAITADAIVVLTGGKERVEHGFDMLAQGAAPILFVSGVGSHATVTEMLAKHASRSMREEILRRQPEIIFDYVANSTQTNADQTAQFLKARRIASIRLVTAHYHMKRSMLEFQLAMPGVKLIPDPVFPDDFRRNEWWQHDNTRRLLFSEFHKYFAVLFRDWLA